MRDLSCGLHRIYLDVEVRRVACRHGRTVKQERLEFLADNPFYTKRFAFWVGRRCRASTIQDVARDAHLNWKTVKALEMRYMREPLRRAGRPGPRKNARIRLAVMDRWKAFRNSTNKTAPVARILFDTFHVLRHLSDALDTVRKQEYARLRPARSRVSSPQDPDVHASGNLKNLIKSPTQLGEEPDYVKPRFHGGFLGEAHGPALGNVWGIMALKWVHVIERMFARNGRWYPRVASASYTTQPASLHQ